MSKKDAYERKLQAQLDAWSAEIDRLKARADEVRADARPAFRKQIESLRRQKQAAQAKLGELRRSSGDAWEDLKEGIDGAWARLGEAVKSAASRFK